MTSAEKQALENIQDSLIQIAKNIHAFHANNDYKLLLDIPILVKRSLQSIDEMLGDK